MTFSGTRDKAGLWLRYRSRTALAQRFPFGGQLRDAARIAFAPTRRNVLHWLSWAVTLTIILALTGALANGAIYGWEIELTRAIQSIGYPDWLFQLTASSLEDPQAIEGALIVAGAISILWILRLRVEAAIAVVALPLHVLGNFPKGLIDRARPSELFDGIFGVGGGMSFTSGHSEFAVTFYGFLAYLAVVRVRSPSVRVGVVLAWLSLVLLVGFGRVAHGHHWPLDIAGGYIVGIGLLSGLIWLHQAFTRATDEDKRAAEPKVEAEVLPAASPSRSERSSDKVAPGRTPPLRPTPTRQARRSASEPRWTHAARPSERSATVTSPAPRSSPAHRV